MIFRIAKVMARSAGNTSLTSIPDVTAQSTVTKNFPGIL